MAEEVKTTETQQPQVQPAAAQPAAPAVDMDKLSDILEKKLSVTEKGVMKSYFEQQGLSPEEAAQAIEQFKTGRQNAQAEQGKALSEAQQALQAAQAAQAELVRMRLENEGRRQAAALGLDEKSADYALRLADMSKATGQDGTISEEAIKNALEQVLKDIPALAPKNEASGFRDIGLPSAAQQTQAPITPQNTKRWNRFNHNM